MLPQLARSNKRIKKCKADTELVNDITENGNMNIIQKNDHISYGKTLTQSLCWQFNFHVVFSVSIEDGVEAQIRVKGQR
jgi:hypothetical protein